MFYNIDYKTTYRCNSIHSLMISKIALIAIATLTVLGLGAANNAYAHNSGYGSIGSYNNGNNYNNNGGGDPYNNNYGPYDNNNNWQNDNWNNNGHHRHHHFNDFNNNDFNQRDVRINQPVDNSGDIRNADSNAAAKLNCDSRTICQGVNVNTIGNGNTVIVNTNAAGQQDGGGPY